MLRTCALAFEELLERHILREDMQRRVSKHTSHRMWNQNLHVHSEVGSSYDIHGLHFPLHLKG